MHDICFSHPFGKRKSVYIIAIHMHNCSIFTISSRFWAVRKHIMFGNFLHQTLILGVILFFGSYFFSVNSERAKELAEAVGSEALSLEQLSTFRPTTEMVLANTTSVGMHPNIADTPIPKVLSKC
mgnify:FL=1